MPRTTLNLKVSPAIVDPAIRKELEQTYERLENEIDRLWASIGVGVPIGGGVDWYGPASTIPPRFAAADGRPISKTKYPGLFAAFGYRHGGQGDTFNLPDRRGKLLAAARGGLNTAELFANYGDTVQIAQGAGDPVSVFLTIPIVRIE